MKASAAGCRLYLVTPPALDRVVKTCLAKDPEDRWQTARDVLLQLKWIQEGGSLAGLPAPVAARRRNREHTFGRAREQQTLDPRPESDRRRGRRGAVRGRKARCLAPA